MKVVFRPHENSPERESIVIAGIEAIAIDRDGNMRVTMFDKAHDPFILGHLVNVGGQFPYSHWSLSDGIMTGTKEQDHYKYTRIEDNIFNSVSIVEF